jgi:tetratricopeptide (TPR) repeat protein
MKRVLLACALLVIGTTAWAAPDPSDKVKRENAALTQARVAILTSKPADAIALLDPLLAELEADAATHKERLYSGQTPEQTLAYMLIAAADRVSATDIGPLLGEANFWKGFALTDLGRASEALSFYERAVALAPSNPQFICELARLHATRKETDIALKLFDRCLAENMMAPEMARPHVKAVALRGRGYVLIDMDKLAEAERAYRDSLQIEPNNPVALGDLKYIAQMRAHPGQGKI